MMNSAYFLLFLFGVYVVVFPYILETENFLSTVMFKVIPMSGGLLCIALSAGYLGWIEALINLGS